MGLIISKNSGTNGYKIVVALFSSPFPEWTNYLCNDVCSTCSPSPAN